MQRGEVDAAVKGYEALVQEGIEDAQLSFNLGNAYVRQGQLGRAIAAYRSSEKLAPRDQDVRKNLELVRAQVSDAVTPPGPSAIATTLFFWHFALSTRESLIVAVLANLGLFLVLALRRVGLARSLTPFALPTFIVLELLFVPSWGVKALAPSDVAVVRVPEAQVHASHQSDAVVRFVLHDGAEARVTERNDTWARIELADGKQGWVELNSVELAPL